MKNIPKQKQDWEKRFDELFEELSHCGRTEKDFGKNIIKDFIFSELQRLIEEVREKVENYFATKGFSSTNPDVAINLKYAQNTIRKELLSELNKLKGIMKNIPKQYHPAVRKLIKKAREEEAKKILDEFFDLHRLYYENKTRRLNNYE